jgi:hypothetical protein
MHGNAIGFGRTPSVAAAYCAVAVILFGCSQLGLAGATEPEHEGANEEELPVAQLEAERA